MPALCARVFVGYNAELWRACPDAKLAAFIEAPAVSTQRTVTLGPHR